MLVKNLKTLIEFALVQSYTEDVQIRFDELYKMYDEVKAMEEHFGEDADISADK